MSKNKIYICETCNYKTSRSYDYNRHMSSYKHASLSEFANLKSDNEDNEFFTCICKKNINIILD